MDEIKTVVAKNISDLRIKAGITQVELAEKLHYSDKAVSKWERAESLPELSTLVAIADLFGVSLDALVREPVLLQKTDLSDSGGDRNVHKNRMLITRICVLAVWFVAIVIFVLVDIIAPSARKHIITFAYAIPASMIVLLVLNSIWFNKRKNYLIISVMVWSLLAAIQLTFLLFDINIWQLYFIGLPAQAIIILCSCFKKR